MGLYLGVATRLAPILHDIYRETNKRKDKEIDRLWQLVHFGFHNKCNNFDKILGII